MRYWKADQEDFIDRVGVAPDTRVLDLSTDGHLCATLSERIEQPVVATGTPRRVRGALVQAPDAYLVACEADDLPFKSGSFDAVLTYHGLEMYPAERLAGILGEALRVLRPGGLFAALIRSSTAFTPAQEADLDLARALEKQGKLFLHEYGGITQALGEAGFEDITMEIVKRDVPVPEEWRKAHGQILKKLGRGVAGAEALLPAIQFTAARED